MVEYEIKALKADGVNFNFKRGFLYHQKDKNLHTWEIELLCTTDDRMIEKGLYNDKPFIIDVSTGNGHHFVGEALIHNVNEGPDGSNVLFNGLGDLTSG
ncbi:hypothetical protein E2R51_06105 [Jeotgalibacillus sp. S-D1]|uniref:hypothetical protein n=1 Tax=Jeotgalibacillus sp. S-D1 TaxID=2552189 RepID=UPI001059C4A3|nr:hypothetical protein [Jeotgalibacillus sp. S-D1]TDL35286.1 hypothetical protein E2R51_06105 [Jeotgalibacillus sp. S-D1]